jgi:phosphate:Na+ symporter
MYKKLFFFPILILLGYGLLSNNDFKAIASGIAIFIVGMTFMEDGFKLFTGGALEKVLKKTTDNVVKAIFSGFVSTAIIQSSSLVSVIAISFLSAELITLAQAIGVIFGSNIGTTATAWIVAGFGVKIKIAYYAMPMLVFGVIFTFIKSKPVKGAGYILLGLGFIFLGIGYMKDGFETLKQGIDLAEYAMDGYLGIFVYIFIGAVATVIIQSSSATMAIIITAVATGQIEYINAISLAIGANVGTTVTAVLGALTSNADGKRLAVAHFIFNMVTALFTVVFIYVLIDFVEEMSRVVGIAEDNIALKLALFHTVFNAAGVLIVSPFIGKMVIFLNRLFIYKGEKRGKPIYLDEEVVQSPGPALAALFKETEHLYDSVSHLTVQALRLHRHEVWSKTEMREVTETVKGEGVDVDAVYQDRIKALYGEIIRFAVMAEEGMDENEREQVFNLKIANRKIIEVTKDINEIQKNIVIFMNDNNEDTSGLYNTLRTRLAQLIREIDLVRKDPEDLDAAIKIVEIRDSIKEFDTLLNKQISTLLRENKIDGMMASSVMNDASFLKSISRRFLETASILWVDDSTIQELQMNTGGES